MVLFPLRVLLSGGVLAACALALGLGLPQARATDATDRVVPGELVADPATLECLSFRWLLSGDDNGNATAVVSYRREGDQSWRDGPPMMRVNREVTDRDYRPYTAGNLLAGSIFGLSPGTRYEVRIRLVDPDGGSAERIVRTATRPEPAPPAERTVNALPDDDQRIKPGSGFLTLSDAVRQAKPGDRIAIAPGLYRGPLVLNANGTDQHPISLRADTGAILEGTSDDGTVIDVSGRSGVWIEGLTIRRGRIGIKARGAAGLVVQRCRIEDVNNGILSNSPDSSGWLISDNEITGRVKNWYPRVDSSDTGISCAGRGHVIRHNRIRSFWDCISIQNYGQPKPEWAEASQPPQVAIDIYRNDCSEALDDGIEADGGLYNIRVFENRVMNVHSGITAQPNHGGPLYLIRNVVYNTTNSPLKLHNYPTGLVVCNNTLIGAGQAFVSYPPAWQNTTFRNNLFLGAKRYAVESGSPDRRTTLDHDGFARAPGSDLVFRWSADGGKSWQRYADVAAFSKGTGHEAHGFLTDYGQFVRAAAPKEGSAYAASDIDLRLTPGARAIDAGCELTGITGSFAGSAPDCGAYEASKSPPAYGPRRAQP